MLLTVRSPLAVLGFVIVTVCAALTVPTTVPGKVRLRLGGLMVEVAPVPEIRAECKLPGAGALSVRLSCAERAPAPVGLNARFTVVLPFAGTVIGFACVGGVKPTKLKSAAFVPPMATAVMTSGPVPGFVIVTGNVALVLPTN